MNVPVILNGENTVINASGDEKLLSVLRKLNLFSVKSGCEEGKCGFCTVLVDDRPVPSCLIPAAILKNREITTLEYFSRTNDYEEITSGFEQAGIKLCGFCNSAKIFSVYHLLNTYYRPSREQMIEVAESVQCSCTERDQFINGIVYATANKHKRDGRKKNV